MSWLCTCINVTRWHSETCSRFNLWQIVQLKPPRRCWTSSWNNLTLSTCVSSTSWNTLDNGTSIRNWSKVDTKVSSARSSTRLVSRKSCLPISAKKKRYSWGKWSRNIHSQLWSDFFFFSYTCHEPWLASQEKHLYLQNVAGISRHSALSEDRIRQCGTSFGSRHKDADQCKSPFPSAGTAVTIFCTKTVQWRSLLLGKVKSRLMDCGGHTLRESWLPEPISSYGSIDYWRQLVGVFKISGGISLNILTPWHKLYLITSANMLQIVRSVYYITLKYDLTLSAQAVSRTKY